MPKLCLHSSIQGWIHAVCLISTQGYTISCGYVTIGCLCGSAAVWGRRAAAARHSASQAASASFLDCMKSSQIFRPFSTRGHVIYQMNGSLCWTVELVTVYHAKRQVSPQYYFHCRGLFSAGIFAYLQGMAWLKRINNNIAWNSLWTHWMAITEH